MLNLKERPQKNKSASVLRIAPATLAPAFPVQIRDNTGHTKPGTVRSAGKRAFLNFAAGIARIERVVSGRSTSERDRSRYAINAFQIQKHIGIAASWPQIPSR